MFWVIATTLGQYRLNFTIKYPGALRAEPSSSANLILMLDGEFSKPWIHHQAYGCIHYQCFGMSCFIKKEHRHGSPSKLEATPKWNAPAVMKKMAAWHSNETVVSHGLFLLFLVALSLQGRVLTLSRTYLMSTERRRWISRVPFPHYYLCQPKRYCVWWQMGE